MNIFNEENQIEKGITQENIQTKIEPKLRSNPPNLSYMTSRNRGSRMNKRNTKRIVESLDRISEIEEYQNTDKSEN